MARDDFEDRERGQRARDDRYGRDIPPGREGGADRDPYAGALYGQSRSGSGPRERDRYDARDLERAPERYQSQGDVRDVAYGDDTGSRRERMDTSGRAGIGGGMGREGGGRYAGRPEDDARSVRYDRDDYDGGWDASGLRGGRGEGRGRDPSFDRDDVRYDAYGASGAMRDRSRGGTMGGGMGGNAGWRDASGGRGSSSRDDGGRDAQDRWAREQWERSMHGDSRWERDYRGEGPMRDAQRDVQRDVQRPSPRDLQRGLQSGGTMGDFSGIRDHRSEYGAGYAHEYGREGDYGHRGGGVSGRPGGTDDVRSSGGGRYGGAQGGAAGSVPDRNPGQGFGGFGYSNVDESSDRAFGTGRGAAGARDFRGRGPRNYQRSDERIREDVCERLTHHRDIDATDIDIGVRGGVVTLSGQVEDKHAKRLAEDIAEEVMGVTEVQNELKAARGGFLGALFGRGERHESEHRTADGHDRHDRQVARETEREPMRDTTRGAYDARTAGDTRVDPATTTPSDLGSIGVAATGPSGATGALGAPDARVGGTGTTGSATTGGTTSGATTSGATGTGRSEARRGRGSGDAGA